MPIVDVTCGPDLSADQLDRLAQMLPHAVSTAVDCPEEPYDHPLEPGDVIIRFTRAGRRDVCGLDVVVEVRSKWFASRADDRQQRCDRLRDAIIEATGARGVGIYLTLPVAAWSQAEGSRSAG